MLPFPTKCRLRTAVISGAILGLSALAGYWLYLLYGELFPAPPEKSADDFRTTRYVLPQDPITKFPIKSPHEADGILDPGELVLGVTIGKESRAYPVSQLNQSPARKVLNDTLGGTAIVV